jgi:hypothetical protein
MLQNPTAEEVDYWHQQYIETLQALFDRHSGLKGGKPTTSSWAKSSLQIW